jgi:glycosyltransferase involved in cell wall biosynthesis
MKEITIANISTFLPRECGIATFSNNLLKSIVNNNIDDGLTINPFVVAIDKCNDHFKYPKIVKYKIRQNQMADYINTANFINYSNANLCILQHEFGIFGGESGTYILSLIQNLKIPFVVVYHTVLEEPTYTQKIIVQKISEKASKIIVMNKLAIRFLKNIYGVPEKKVIQIEHGVPNFKFLEPTIKNKRLDFKGKKVLLTFGLINRNKGIETVLEALTEVVKKHKDIIYVILGKTHPNVIKESGEEYRNYLHQLVHKYKLSNYVYFYNHFVTDEELFDYVSATDIYIVPYLNKAQMTSGPLSYAVGAGCAVISTPFWHAEELLSDNKGLLYDFGDYQSLSEKLMFLLDNPEEMLAYRKRAYTYGRSLIWSETGNKYAKLIQKIVQKNEKTSKEEVHSFNSMIMPAFSLKHIKKLTYNTGIIQHATYNVPNLKTGYCIDDNSRALLMTVMAWNQLKDEDALNLIPKYLSFVAYMQNEDGSFRNFLSFDNQYLDEQGSEDSFGRTIWALGYLIHYPPNSGYFQLASELFSKAIPNFNKLKEIRSIACTANGLYHYLKRNPSDEKMMVLYTSLTNKIINKIQIERDTNWVWFENKLTYCNGIIPLTLFYAYKLIKDKKTLHLAIEVLNFLNEIKFKNNYLNIIGNDGWFEKGKSPAEFAQQPVNVTAMILAYYQAYKVTKKKSYLDNMYTSYLWFLGDNKLAIPLYNFDTEGCSDGLESFGINKNQGAESTISYLIAHLKVLRALNDTITHN